MNDPIAIIDGWDWSFRDHIRTSMLYKNSQFTEGNDRRDLKPFKNITRPILNVQYRATGFDVKDIEIFVDDSEDFYKSFLIKKYHEKWALEHRIDTFIDEVVESYVDYGGTLVKKTKDAVPDVVPLQSVCFCDQTDIISGPIGIRHYYAPDQLKEMEELGWGSEAHGATATIDEVIRKASQKKESDYQTGQENKTPGRYVEVYEVHGMFPSTWMSDGAYEGTDGDQITFTRQIHIVACYKAENDEKAYVTLFRGNEKENPFRVILRDPVYGRALGIGGAEELFDPQVWVNYSSIRKIQMLDAASVTVLKSTDPAVSAKHPTGLKNLKNLSIVDLAPNTDIGQVDTVPRSERLFDLSTQEWEAIAQKIGSAQEAIMGDEPPAGTPFKSVEFQAAENHSLHEYRKGKIAVFIGDIYREWIIPQLATELISDHEFLAELSFDEMQEVAEATATSKANRFMVEKVLNGEVFSREEVETFKLSTREQFMASGNRKFIKILKDEMKRAPLSIRINIVGKQFALAARVDKLTNFVREIVRMGPQILQMPGISDTINEILEASGLSPIDFGSMVAQQRSTGQVAQNIQQPIQQLPQNVVPA